MLELAAVIAAAIASVWWPVPALIGLVVAGTASRLARGRRWSEPGAHVRGLVPAGAALGLAALGLALVVATPVVEGATARAVEWSKDAIVRGSVAALVTVAMLVIAQAVAAELVFRRWILDRVHDAGARGGVAVVIAAIAEGATAGGHLGARLGAVALGAGLGLVYLGAGRRLAPAIACRVTFEVGVLVALSARIV